MQCGACTCVCVCDACRHNPVAWCSVGQPILVWPLLESAGTHTSLCSVCICSKCSVFIEILIVIVWTPAQNRLLAKHAYLWVCILFGPCLHRLVPLCISLCLFMCIDVDMWNFLLYHMCMCVLIHVYASVRIVCTWNRNAHMHACQYARAQVGTWCEDGHLVWLDIGLFMSRCILYVLFCV